MSKLLYLVAVDGSEQAKRAVERAVNLALHTDASVKLISVMDCSFIQPMAMEGEPLLQLNREAEQASLKAQVIEPLLKEHQDKSVNIDSEVLAGDPVTLILKQSKETHANMLFVGRQGRSRVVDILMGSVANKLAHQAGIPIVLVP